MRDLIYLKGCFSEVTGPVLPELIAQTNSDYQLIAQSVSMRGVGHAVGGVIGASFPSSDVCNVWVNS